MPSSKVSPRLVLVVSVVSSLPTQFCRGSPGVHFCCVTEAHVLLVRAVPLNWARLGHCGVAHHRLLRTSCHSWPAPSTCIVVWSSTSNHNRHRKRSIAFVPVSQTAARIIHLEFRRRPWICVARSTVTTTRECVVCCCPSATAKQQQLPKRDYNSTVVTVLCFPPTRL